MRRNRKPTGTLGTTRRRALGAAAAAALVAGPGTPLVTAQPADDADGVRTNAPVDVATLERDSPLRGRPIRSLELRVPAPGGGFVPLGGRTAQIAANNVRSEPGRAFDPQAVREDIDRLNRLGRFRRIEASVQPLADGGVALAFTVETQPLIRDVQSAGNREISDQQIAEFTRGLIGTPVDRFQIDRARRSVEELYRERGYLTAEITINEAELAERDVVLLEIREGPRVRVGDIRFEAFEGALAFGRRQLGREIELRRKGLFRKGPIDRETIRSDELALERFYRDSGFLDARANALIQPSPDGREAIVTYIIDQGRRYTLREVDITILDQENSPLSEEQVLGHMTLRPGQTFGERAVRESIEAVRDAFARLGHIGTDPGGRRVGVPIVVSEFRDPDRPLVDLVLEIEAGPLSRTGLVIIGGNELTRQDVIRRELEITPGAPLDGVAIRESENRLRRLRLFSPAPPDRGVKITPQPADPAEPEFRDVLVEVEETNTGSFDIGGAVSSDSGFFGRIAITQNNFDASDVPDSVGEFFVGAFRGGGQTFNIEALPGNEVQQYSIGLSEPHLFNTDYSGSFQAFFRDREFQEFDETRFGGRFSFARRFGTRWVGGVNLRVESVDISDIEPFQPTDFFLFEDQTLILGFGPSLVRTTVDDRLFPTRGTRTEVRYERVEGDTTFDRFAGEHTVFIPLREDFIGRRTVLSLRSEVQYIPQDEDEVPVFERFFLGGQSFRGFEFRTISPRGVAADTGEFSDEPIGGTFLLFLGTELRFPLAGETFYGVVFVDSGLVTFEPTLDDYRVSAGVGLRIRLPGLGPVPLAFDLGFPVISETGDEEQVFSFSLDLPF